MRQKQRLNVNSETIGSTLYEYLHSFVHILFYYAKTRRKRKETKI